MPIFKSPKGVEIEVTEEFAEQVLRPQNKYVEVHPQPVQEVKEPKPKVSKKKTKKKSNAS